MDLKALLGKQRIEMRKEEYGKVIGSSPETYAELVQLSFSRELPVCWRAAWMVDHLAELHPHLPLPYIDRFWQFMPEDHPHGVTRSILRMLSRYEIPEEYQGIATDLCLDWLVKESIPVAIKAFSMEIIHNIAKEYPELKEEFIAVMEDQIPYNSAGFKARAHHIIKAMEKL